jgi:hypothetical protein
VMRQHGAVTPQPCQLLTETGPNFLFAGDGCPRNAPLRIDCPGAISFRLNPDPAAASRGS